MLVTHGCYLDGWYMAMGAHQPEFMDERCSVVTCRIVWMMGSTDDLVITSFSVGLFTLVSLVEWLILATVVVDDSEPALTNNTLIDTHCQAMSTTTWAASCSCEYFWRMLVGWWMPVRWRFPSVQTLGYLVGIHQQLCKGSGEPAFHYGGFVNH